MPRLLDPVRDYLGTARCAVLCSLRADGEPQQVVVHYLLDADHLLVNGSAGRRWVANLRRDPRVSLVVHDADRPLHWVGIRGRAEGSADGPAAARDAMTIARRYGEDPANYQHLQRASFKIVPHHVFEYGAEREDVVPPLPGTQATSLTVRPARARDWNAIWPFMRPIIAGGDTFSWDRDTSEEDARAAWMHEPPGRTFVAVGTRGQIIGTAEMEPNHGGPGAHVATAGFMVDPSYEGHGAGRALCQHVLEQARADGYRAIQFNAVAETNTRAVKLWRSLGFTVLVRIPEAFAHPDHGDVALLIMHQKLQPSGQSQEGDGPQPAPTWTSPAK